jgi:hypothetical protein
MKSLRANMRSHETSSVNSGRAALAQRSGQLNQLKILELERKEQKLQLDLLQMKKEQESLKLARSQSA